MGNDGAFVPVSNLTLSEPLDPYTFFQQITLAFDPVIGDAVRIRGDAGGSNQFTSIVELEAYGQVPEPATLALLAAGAALAAARRRSR